MTPRAAERIILSEGVLIPLLLHVFRRCRGMKHGENADAGHLFEQRRLRLPV
jgi:hypothetical protein